jgi:hypothetical protein
MSKRRFSKCAWCGRTINVTNQDRDLCDQCAKFDNIHEMLAHSRKQVVS